MTEPLTLPGSSARHQLPFLYPGQAQKEAFVNEALARIDVLLESEVKGIASSPPASPAEGECWLVGANPTGAWSNRSNAIAGWAAGSWTFCTPRTGMRVWDVAAGRQRIFNAGWQMAASPVAPAGGNVIDIEARSAIAGLIGALKDAGLLRRD